MSKFFLPLVFFFFFAPNVFSKHCMVGTEACFESGSFQIISDIEVNNLKIRHVRQTDSTSCANKSQNDDHIEMSGPINPDTPFILEKLLNKIVNSPNRCTNPTDGSKYAVRVYLNSGGGYMKDGYELGNLFRRVSASTYIPITAECFSSCATAFLGGKFRELQKGGKLMFHAPYSYTSRYDISCSKKDTQLLTYMKKMLNETDGDFLYKRTMSYCSQSSGWSLNRDAAEIFGLLK